MRRIFILSPILLLSFQVFAQGTVNFESKQKELIPAPDQAAPVPTFSAQAHLHHTTLPQTPFATMHGTPSEIHSRTATPIPSVEVIYHQTNGTPIWIKGNTTESLSPFASAEARLEAAFQQLEALGTILPYEDIRNELSLTHSEYDSEGIAHIEFQQVLNEIPVRNAEVQVHFFPGGTFVVNGRMVQLEINGAMTPTIDAFTAGQLALSEVDQHHHVVDLPADQQEILHYSGPQTRLVWYEVPGVVRETRLAYEVTTRPNFIHRWEYLIDAISGEVLLDYDHTCSIGPKTASGTDLNGSNKTVDVFQATNGTYYLLDASKSMYTGPTNTLPGNGDGFIITADWQNNTPSNSDFKEITSTNNSWSALNISAHHNASLAFDYFENAHSHVSIDANGGDIISFVNVADDNGQGLDNAYWNGAAMFYGNGLQAFKPLAGALDVAGHEMAHGVIQATANLEYQGESGALNESFADIFGVMIDRNDWTLGEDVVQTQYFPSGALRSMSDPHNGGTSLNDNGFQPKHTNEQYTGSQDNGGVHINSGIPNHAFYLFATATTKDKAEDVYYRALEKYHTRSSQFLDSRLAVVQAATDLFGANSTEVNAAKSAFDQVGILNGQPGNYDPTIPTNPGSEFIVSTDINPADQNTLYLSSTTGTNYQPLSTTEQNRRPSITDDGAVGVFVDMFNDVNRIFIDPANPNESTLTSDQYWDNVAVTKDGSKLALVSKFIDTALWVYDFGTQQWGKYRLYNPTYTQGINTGDVLYADAISWDLTGQYVMYDAFNRISSTTTADIEYWDIGIIQVWDNNQNSFGNGIVTKVFSSLDPGESVGNAVFSTNSPNVIAFDYINDNTGENSVYAANIEFGQIGTIFTPGVLGVPAFSNDDSKMIFNGQDNQGNDVIGVIDLAADKINAASGAQASVLIPAAKWGIWIAQGDRDIQLSTEEELTGMINVYPNPVQDVLTITMEEVPSGAGSLIVSDLAGRQLHVETWSRQQSAGEWTIEMSAFAAGIYLVELRADGGRKVIKVEKR